MFFILGADGKEYGPATVAQIRSWMHGGRANLATKVKAAGSDEWRQLGDFPEFNPAAALPPPLLAPELETAGVPALPAVVPDEPELAGIGARTGAALVNAAIYFGCAIPGSILMVRKLITLHPEITRGVVLKPQDIDIEQFREPVAWVWAGLLAAILVQCIFVAARGQNIGKMLCGGRVVRADDGEPAGVLRAVVLRFLLPVAIVILLNAATVVLGFVFLIVDYCFIFREDRRCLHDLMAGTKVVRR